MRWPDGILWPWVPFLGARRPIRRIGSPWLSAVSASFVELLPTLPSRPIYIDLALKRGQFNYLSLSRWNGLCGCGECRRIRSGGLVVTQSPCPDHHSFGGEGDRARNSVFVRVATPFELTTFKNWAAVKPFHSIVTNTVVEVEVPSDPSPPYTAITG
jgi:hypothetical protein